MILRNMITRIQGRLDDDVYWNDKRLKAILNQVQDKIAQELAITTPHYYSFESVQGQQHYQVPSGFVANELIHYNSGVNKVISIMKSPKAIHGVYTDPTMEGNPSIGYIWGSSGRRQLTIYPTFSSDGITIEWWFWGFPNELVGDNDEPTFPSEMHPSLVECTIAEAKSDDKEISISDALIIFANEIRKLRRLESMIEIIGNKGRYGSIDNVFPSIPGSPNVPQFYDSTGEIIW